MIRPPSLRSPLLVRRAGAVVAVVGALVALAQLPTTSAAFTAATANAGNSFASAGTWCTTPGAATTTVQNDTMLAQDDPDGNYGGAVQISVRSQAGGNRDVLVRPSLPAVPPGCDITSATLRFRVVSFTGGRTYQARRATTPWDVFAVTWSSRPSTTGPATTAMTTNTTWEIDITPQVQAIVAAGPGQNHGVLISDTVPDASPSRTNTYDTLDGTTPAVVDYAWG
ncbi:MAG: DNRLRE domain-containing protein [Acidimicrobiales bacterium]|nr:DNRLRE domain-containing protein [Acidimicrobiales bacterium]